MLCDCRQDGGLLFYAAYQKAGLRWPPSCSPVFVEEYCSADSLPSHTPTCSYLYPHLTGELPMPTSGMSALKKEIEAAHRSGTSPATALADSRRTD